MNRIRGRKLQAIRKNWLNRHPLCVACTSKGYITAATQVDHIIPLFKGGADNHTNRQSLCDECHTLKTRHDLGQRINGCNVHGEPLGGWKA